MSKSDWSGAITHFNRAIELNPNYVEAYGNRGAAKNANKDLDGALVDFDKAIELKPDSPGFKEVRKHLKQEMRRLKDAVPANSAADKRKFQRQKTLSRYGQTFRTKQPGKHFAHPFKTLTRSFKPMLTS